MCKGYPSFAYSFAYLEIVLKSNVPYNCNILKILENAAGTPAHNTPSSGTSLKPLVTKFKKLNFLGDKVFPFKTTGFWFLGFNIITPSPPIPNI